MSARPIRVKICGITRPEDAIAAVDLGADYLGLNFFAGSPRVVSLETAAEIADAIGRRASLVGVFVNRPPDEVERIAARVPLDLLQFHGDESPDTVERFAERAIRALRVDGPIDERAIAPYPSAWGFLVDVRHPDLYGGTGISWPYDWIDTLPRDRPVLIAGGIGPGTARAAVRAASAWGIDVCSAVESAPGIKDHDLLRRLFAEVKGERDAS